MQPRQRPGRELRVEGRFAGEVSHFEIGGDKRIYQHLSGRLPKPLDEIRSTLTAYGS